MGSICLSCKHLRKEEYCYGNVKYMSNHNTKYTCDEPNANDEMFLILHYKSELPEIKECKSKKLGRIWRLKNKWNLFWTID